MERYKVLYKRPDWDSNLSITIEANSEEEVRNKFKQDPFKKFEIINIQTIF